MGIGIGGEYPAGSVAASEHTEAPGIKKGSQHFLFTMATNVQIDFGFVIAALVPLVWLYILGEGNLNGVWRGSLGLGAGFAILVLVWRLRLRESKRYQLEGMKNARIPYLLIWKRYWLSWCGLSTAWFLYNFISYPFSLYSSTIIVTIIGGDPPLTQALGWSVVINLFYMPGCITGA
jgi:predicted cobalt transporter CbtA